MSRVAIALACCLVLAGCAAPTAQPDSPGPATGSDPATTSDSGVGAGQGDGESAGDSSDATDIPVSGGDLGVDHERTFDRTVELLGVDASPPTVIVVESAADIRSDTGGATTTPGSESRSRSFLAVLGIGQERASDAADDSTDDDTDDPGSDDVSIAAYTPSGRSVIVNERMTTAVEPPALERTLAHEYVHVVQFRTGAFERLQDAFDDRPVTRDRYLTYASVTEGVATYVGSEYDRRYLEGNWATITAPERYRNAPSGVKYSIARYYFGGRYVDSRVDSPANVSTVYGHPPTTTEQLVHNYTPGEEPPADLTVSTTLDGNWTLGSRNTNGEIVTRIALGTELNESRAASAAAGWGADRLVAVERENRSFVWATRWDSPAEADEFETAVGDYLESRANRSGGVWRDAPLAFRTVRTGEETVVLLAGEEPFVRNASISGTNATVSVSVGR